MSDGLLGGKKMFACPVCATPCDVRITKKKKPYITCDPCGIQLFVRGPAWISAFSRAIERGGSGGTLSNLREMERRYHLECLRCGCRFWIEPQLARTSVFDGSLQGFRCPEKKCGATVRWEKQP